MVMSSALPSDRGDAGEGGGRVAEQRLHHPRPHHDQDHEDRDHLRNERQGHLVDLGDGLEDRHEQADDEAHEEEWPGQHHHHQDRLLADAEDHLLGHVTKLSTSDLTIRCQPSTITNSSSLNGSEIITGGSISMPIDIRVLETTMSMIRNGTKTRKPIWKAVFSSLMTNAGTSV